MSRVKEQVIVSAAFVLVLGIAFLIYLPGIPGPFLLDDFVHLPRLSQYGGIESLEKLLRFGLETGGASGRPISYLSFALNDQYWPSSPEPFKYTNVCIHLLNAVLVFVLSRSLFARTLGDHRTSNILALVLMSIWALHPIQHSTVLYVIQRMTELSTLFVLAGLLVYLRGRFILQQKPLPGFLLMSLGVAGFGGLAVLSKETGVLIVMYILVLESTLIPYRMATESTPPHFDRYLTYWKVIFVFLPIAAVIGYYLLRWDTMQALWDQRPFTPDERLLTQARVLSEYLWRTLVPTLGGTGVFHDDYAHSTGLLSPPTTLYALLLLASLLSSALYLRRRYPIYSFGILWWFAGHVLEGTMLPLELYFEHRNYLPSLGPLLALVYLAYSLIQCRPHLHRLGYLATAGLSVGFIALTALNVQTWGNARSLYEVAAIEHPHSVRAKFSLGIDFFRRGNVDEALSLLEDLKKTHPHNVGLDITQLYWGCLANKALERDVDLSGSVERIVGKIPRSEYEHLSYHILQELRLAIETGDCGDVTPSDLVAIHAAFEEYPPAPLNSRSRSMALIEIGKAYALARDLNGAVQMLDKAYEAHPVPDIPMYQATWLYSAGLPEEGQRYLRIAEKAPSLSKYISIDELPRVQAIAASLEKTYKTD